MYQYQKLLKIDCTLMVASTYIHMYLEHLSVHITVYTYVKNNTENLHLYFHWLYIQCNVIIDIKLCRPAKVGLHKTRLHMHVH